MSERTRWTGWLLRRAAGLGVLAVAAIWLGWMMFAMPGDSHDGPPPPLTNAQRELRDALEADVRHLAERIGERNVHRPQALAEAADWIAARFEDLGHDVRRQSYTLDEVATNDLTCQNIEVEITGSERPDEIVLFAAHYDTVRMSPGANDNASGVAALLALARAATQATADEDAAPKRTLRLVSFVNEEPPFFQTADMGSYVYAARSRERGENIVAMVSFDGLGYYDDEPGSQRYPLPGLGSLYPDEGGFIAVVGNLSSRSLVRRVVGGIRRHADFPSEGAAIPALVPQVGWSDHWAFWQHGYPGVMVTDTLPFRDPHYHTSADVPDNLDFDRMSHVVVGLKGVMFELAGIEAGRGE